MTDKILSALSQDAQDMYALAWECEGVEVCKGWTIYEELKNSGLVDFGSARGPDNAWVRMWPATMDEEDRCP